MGIQYLGFFYHNPLLCITAMLLLACDFTSVTADTTVDIRIKIILWHP